MMEMNMLSHKINSFPCPWLQGLSSFSKHFSFSTTTCAAVKWYSHVFTCSNLLKCFDANKCIRRTKHSMNSNKENNRKPYFSLVFINIIYFGCIFNQIKFRRFWTWNGTHVNLNFLHLTFTRWRKWRKSKKGISSTIWFITTFLSTNFFLF